MKKKVQQISSHLGLPYWLIMVLAVMVLIVISPIIFLFGGFYLYLKVIKRGNLASVLKSVSLFWGMTYRWAKVLVIFLMIISSPLIIMFSLLLMIIISFRESLNEKELSKLEKETRDWLRYHHNQNLKIHK